MSSLARAWWMESSSPVTGSTMTTFLLRIEGEVGLLSPENEGDVGRLLEDDSDADEDLFFFLRLLFFLFAFTTFSLTFASCSSTLIRFPSGCGSNGLMFPVTVPPSTMRNNKLLSLSSTHLPISSE